MRNKFNLLTSKEWLPFQKSWFLYKGDELLYRENLRFFTKADEDLGDVLYYGEQYQLFERLAKENNLVPATLEDNNQQCQYILIDLRSYINKETKLSEYKSLKKKIIKILKHQLVNLVHRRFITILIPNIQQSERYSVYAWDLAKSISPFISLKDEKIGCIDQDVIEKNTDFFAPQKDVFYCLYFRNDEYIGNQTIYDTGDFFRNNNQVSSSVTPKNKIPWSFILKPQPRKKNEILHPAKYPEELVNMFLLEFTDVQANVFDPTSGTGSTQIAAMKSGRNGYGTELSEFFAEIAINRCIEYSKVLSSQDEMQEHHAEFKILNKDARLITPHDFPTIDYMITSPPYWDMLNMKGAENQAKRIEKGLRTNYSEDQDDIGNISDYVAFLETLKSVYLNVAKIMKPGSYMTIVVKNIKKKGSNYPFAWDLASMLQEKLILLPEVFWCQDDISIAPYGYGNTFVTNTFHQYCLTFQIPFGYS